MSAVTVGSAPGISPAPATCQRTGIRIGGLLACAAAVVLLCFLSMAIGTRTIPIGTVWDAIAQHDPSNTDHLVVMELRLPRTILGLLVGASLGLAGGVMQGVTRNPLADPGILGVNSGAALFVVIAIAVFHVSSILGYVWFAFAGAGPAAVVVYCVASLGREGATPVKLAPPGRSKSPSSPR
jgi:iron complex transport system permease protein